MEKFISQDDSPLGQDRSVLDAVHDVAKRLAQQREGVAVKLLLILRACESMEATNVEIAGAIQEWCDLGIMKFVSESECILFLVKPA